MPKAAAFNHYRIWLMADKCRREKRLKHIHEAVLLRRRYPPENKLFLMLWAWTKNLFITNSFSIFVFYCDPSILYPICLALFPPKLKKYVYAAKTNGGVLSKLFYLNFSKFFFFPNAFCTGDLIVNDLLICSLKKWRVLMMW